MKPVIGITPSPATEAQPHGEFRRHVLNEAYTAAIAAAGGIPVILPPQSGSAGDLVERVDGLLLSGGADFDPSHFGQSEVHPATYGIDAERDGFELELVPLALAADLPILGICRGIQTLNVALGGTLIQDIPSLVGTTTQHRQHEDGLEADAIGHQVTLADHPSVGALFKGSTLGVNSFHHQSLDRVAPSLLTVATADDGVIEAVTLPGSRFVIGLQWHPELMFRRHPEQLRPFSALVSAATSARLVAS